MNKARITLELEFTTTTDIENFIAICRDNVAMNNVVGTVPTSKMLIQFLTSAMRNAPTICSYVQPMDKEEHDYNVGLEVLYPIDVEPKIKKKKQRKDGRDLVADDLVDAMAFGLAGITKPGKFAVPTMVGKTRSGNTARAYNQNLTDRLEALMDARSTFIGKPNDRQTQVQLTAIQEEIMHIQGLLSNSISPDRNNNLVTYQKVQTLKHAIEKQHIIRNGQYSSTAQAEYNDLTEKILNLERELGLRNPTSNDLKKLEERLLNSPANGITMEVNFNPKGY